MSAAGEHVWAVLVPDQVDGIYLLERREDGELLASAFGPDAILTQEPIMGRIAVGELVAAAAGRDEEASR